MTIKKQYESWREPFDIAVQILHSLTPQQTDDLVAKLPLDLADKFREIRADASVAVPSKIVNLALAEYFKIIRFTLPEVALDEAKSDAVEITEALFRFQAIKDDSQDPTNEEQIAVTHFNNRFQKEKPFAIRKSYISYTYDTSRVPDFLVQQFTQKVGDTILAALSEDPNADLRPYEKRFGITLTKVEDSKRTTEHKPSSISTSKPTASRPARRPGFLGSDS